MGTALVAAIDFIGNVFDVISKAIKLLKTNEVTMGTYSKLISFFSVLISFLTTGAVCTLPA